MPVKIYDAETWMVTLGLINKFKIAQRSKERAYLEALEEKNRNEVIRNRTGLSKSKSKWQWACLIC